MAKIDEDASPVHNHTCTSRGVCVTPPKHPLHTHRTRGGAAKAKLKQSCSYRTQNSIQYKVQGSFRDVTPHLLLDREIPAPPCRPSRSSGLSEK